MIVLLGFVVLNQGLGQIKGLDLLGVKKKATIPFTLEQGFIVVKLYVEYTFPMRFIFDTGAEHTVIFNKMYGDMLNFDYERKVPIVGSDLSAEMYAHIVRNITVELSGADMVNRDILVLDKDYLKIFESTGILVDGILGGEFFRNLVVEIDYKRNRLILFHPEHFPVPSKSKYDAIPLTIRNNKPYVSAEVASLGDTVTLNFLIDTGASLTFLIHTNTHPALHLPEVIIPGHIGYGLGGSVVGYLGMMDYIAFGPYEFETVLASFQDIGGASLSEHEYFRHGIIGSLTLARFHSYIDYYRSIWYLNPVGKYNQTFDYDKSGLTIFAYGHGMTNFFVRNVLENSPARKAGLKEGDIIIKFQGKKKEKLSIPYINKTLKRKEGKKINMLIERNGEELSFIFRLVDMLKEAKAKQTP
ncbi:MAG TPA: aspartyl protease family protein [Saprospiraceae bacterium]|nr:aspartyl protease family protein [Saprospiraceae bacterium]